MEPNYSLQNLFADLAHFQKVMDDAAGSLSRPEDRQKVQELLGQLQKARAEAEQEIPAIMQEKLKSAEQGQAEMEALQKQVEQAQQDLEAQIQAMTPKPPEPPPAAAAPIDPAIGDRLRAELLDRVPTGRPKPAATTDFTRDLWDAVRDDKH